jgi:hypothetical protein
MILSAIAHTKHVLSPQPSTSTRLRSYFLFSNIISLLLFTLLSASLCNINSVSGRFSQIFVLILTIIFSIICLTFVIFSAKQALQISNLSSSRFLQLQAITQYVLNFPLAYITFYFFTQVHYLRSTGLIDYSILLACTVYFSSTGILNQIVIEIKLQAGFTKLSATKLFFSFLFRYFFFVSKLINAILFLSTRNDYFLFSTDSDSSENSALKSAHSNQIILVFLIYLVAAYTIYFLWYLNVNNKKGGSTFRLFFEPYKMLIDHNDNYFNRKLQSSEANSNSYAINVFVSNFFNFNSITVIFYLFFNFATHLVLAYYWYFCSIITLSKLIQTKINLFNLLNSQSLLTSLYELEEILKFRQFMLVSVLGSMIIAVLAYHIFYQYYFKLDTITEKNEFDFQTGRFSTQECTRKESLLEKARYSLKCETQNIHQSDVIDGFSIDSYQHSSSISSISLPFYSDKKSEWLCPHAVLSMPHLNQSSKSVVIDSLSLTSESSSQFSSSSSFFSSIDFRKEFKTITTLEYETSSGVNSSSLTTSLSSIYQQFHTYEPYSMWTNFNNMKKSKSIENLNLPELSAYDNGVKKHQSSESNKKNLNERISDWFSKANLNNVEFETITSLDRSVSSTLTGSIFQNNCSSPVNVESMINTDTTFKTDKSNFTYLI